MNIERTKTGLLVDGENWDFPDIKRLNNEIGELEAEILSDIKTIAAHKETIDVLHNNLRGDPSNANFLSEIKLAEDGIGFLKDKMNEAKKKIAQKKASLESAYKEAEKEVKESASLNADSDKSKPSGFASQVLEQKPMKAQSGWENVKIEKFTDTEEGKRVIESEKRADEQHRQEDANRGREEMLKKREEESRKREDGYYDEYGVFIRNDKSKQQTTMKNERENLR